jgi:hypothetical protein
LPDKGKNENGTVKKMKNENRLGVDGNGKTARARKNCANTS